MQIQRGQRGNLAGFYDLDQQIDIILQTKGTAVYDYCCFGVDETNRLSDERYMIFYNQICSPENEISYEMQGEKALFHVSLNRLPNTVQKLVFTVSIDGNGTMGEIAEFTAEIRQKDAEPYVLKLLGMNFSKEKAIISFEIYQKNGWRYAAVASGFNGGLGDLLRAYGGVEAQSEEQPEPIVQPVQEEVVPEQTVPRALSNSLDILKKEERVEMCREDGSKISKMTASFSFEKAQERSKIQCDPIILLCQNDKQIASDDIVTFYNLSHKTDAVVMMGKKTDFKIDLTVLPLQYNRIIFAANIFLSLVIKEHFSEIKNCRLCFCDQIGRELFSFSPAIMNSYDAMIFGELIKVSDNWIFHAIGRGTYDHSVAGLASHL